MVANIAKSRSEVNLFPWQMNGHSHASVVTETVQKFLVQHAPLPKRKPKPSFASSESWIPATSALINNPEFVEPAVFIGVRISDLRLTFGESAFSRSARLQRLLMLFNLTWWRPEIL